jgi:ABC-type transport system involved in multi-copper enzyme maturation permease subunit
MEKGDYYLNRKSSLGEMTTEGLFAGLVAGMVMLLYLLGSGLLSGGTVSLVMGRFSIQTPANPVQGAFLHLAVSATYGLLFGIIYTLLRRRFSSWILALLYALAIYLLAHFIVLPASSSRLLDLTPIHFALAHLVYGMVLGVWFRGK